MRELGQKTARAKIIEDDVSCKVGTAGMHSPIRASAARCVDAAVEHLTLLVVCNRRACAPAAGEGRAGNAAVLVPFAMKSLLSLWSSSGRWSLGGVCALLPKSRGARGQKICYLHVLGVGRHAHHPTQNTATGFSTIARSLCQNLQALSTTTILRLTLCPHVDKGSGHIGGERSRDSSVGGH